MFQQIIAIGHLGNDPEVRYTPTGRAVTTFALAVDERQDQETTTTTWFQVSASDKVGDLCAMYLGTGYQVMVIGTVSASTYTDRDGKTQASLKLAAKTVRFLGKGKAGAAFGVDASSGVECRF
jgi:single-strand DNA-binding protein